MTMLAPGKISGAVNAPNCWTSCWKLPPLLPKRSIWMNCWPTSRRLSSG